MKYTIFRTSSFKKAFKKLPSNNQDLVLDVITKLADGESLEAKYKGHLLTGNIKDCRECHVKPDLLLVYRINDSELELILVEVGSHAQLFG
ncbi:MAG: type II toxin-antitoxin system YafQ family toxin [Sulfurospirillum sp.]|nr:type II toxin-antitoxin system YafQ family toxin [Sulfurospirillum sp.]